MATMPPMTPRRLGLQITIRPLNAAVMGAAFLGSFAILVRVLTTAVMDSWTGIGAALLVTSAVVVFGLHAWNLATGRGWRNSLEGEGRVQRLAALETLLSQGRIRRAEYLEERSRILRGP